MQGLAPTGLNLKKPYFHQISLNCIEKLVECLEKFNEVEIDADTSFMIEKQMLTDEIDDLYFISVAMGNLSELLSYIDSGRVNKPEI